VITIFDYGFKIILQFKPDFCGFKWRLTTEAIYCISDVF